MELAKRFVTENFFEEERRLFYVALTRSKKFLYVFSIEDKNSIFLNEISTHLMNIYIDTTERWHQGLSKFISNRIKGITSKLPIICPRCGRILTEKDGRYGKFLGCSGYYRIGCRYTYNLESKKDDYIDLEPLITTDRILNVLTENLKPIKLISTELKIDDDLDIKFLKLKLKEFERKNLITKTMIEEVEYWKTL